MRQSVIRAYALGIITGSMLTAGILFATTPAEATTADTVAEATR